MWRIIIFVVSIATLKNSFFVKGAAIKEEREIDSETEIESPPECIPPMINPGFLEGDIGEIPDEFSENKSTSIDEILNERLKDASGKWPNGVVPYTIDTSLKYLQSNIMSAMEHIVNSTGCIRFSARTDQRDYLWMFRPQRPVCLSETIGRKGGRQFVALGRGCESVGVIVHELLHVLGFWHEHTRPNRDTHIIIKEENFRPGITQKEKYTFMAKMPREVNTFGEPYDYSSIMHYDSYALAKDWNSPTILVRGNPTARIKHPQHKNMSSSDIKRIRSLYDCICNN